MVRVRIACYSSTRFFFAGRALRVRARIIVSAQRASSAADGLVGKRAGD